MKLTILEGELAVCTFSGDKAPPSWIFEGTGFCSVTRTTDEWSGVCSHDLVPSGIKAERGWRCFKVQGPLDFSLSGILASLLEPLARGNVPIFALSTYNMDYILVKNEMLGQAIDMLRLEGHIIDGTDAHRPRDGPAVSFEADPLVADLVKGLAEGTWRHPGQKFSLFMAIGWPPVSTNFEAPYNRFRKAVEACFDNGDRSGEEAAVYFYPFRSLHVTAATVFRPGSAPPSASDQVRITKVWIKIVQSAAALDSWPRAPIELVANSTQIGKRAGIILWRDVTGGVAAIRQSLRAAVSESKVELEAVGLTTLDLDIPPIVHSTFLRFYRKPSTPGETVQQRFSDGVSSKLQDFFPSPVRAVSCKLLNERTPCMLIPHTNDHVLTTSYFSDNQSDRLILDCHKAEQREKWYYSV